MKIPVSMKFSRETGEVIERVVADVPVEAILDAVVDVAEAVLNA